MYGETREQGRRGQGKGASVGEERGEGEVPKSDV